MKQNINGTFRGQTTAPLDGIFTKKGKVFSANFTGLIKSGGFRDYNKITKAESDEAEIQRLLENESTRLHKEMFSVRSSGNIKLFYDLQDSWQEKYKIYEEKIRSEGYLNRIKLNIVIIEDLERIKSSIIEYLPKLLGDKYRLEFEEINNFEDAKSNFETRYLVSETLDKTFYILDNNFYSDSENEYMKSDAGVELYNFLLTNPFIRKKFLDNITILSSDDNIGKKFPEGVNIIEGKSSNNLDYILNISNWVKSILEK